MKKIIRISCLSFLLILISFPCFAEMRIVSLAPSITELVFSLGKGKNIVGTTLYSNYPEEALKIPSIGSYAKPNIEKIISLRPTLVFAIKDGTPLVLVKKLQELNIKVVAINPISVDELKKAILILGKALNTQELAQKKINEFNSALKKIQAHIPKDTKKVRVLNVIQIAPFVTVGRNTFMNNIIELAGAENVITANGYPRISPEKILELKPDFIFIQDMENNYDMKEIFLKKYSYLSILKAQIITINPNIYNRPTMRIILAIADLQMHIFKIPKSKS